MKGEVELDATMHELEVHAVNEVQSVTKKEINQLKKKIRRLETQIATLQKLVNVSIAHFA